PPEEKPLLRIATLGSFRYHVPADRAQFDAPTPNNSGIPQLVEVIRSSRRMGNDTLTCDHLDVQFRKRGAAKAPAPIVTDAPSTQASKPPAESGSGLELQEVRASGQIVVLTSESERLHAQGRELIFNQVGRQSTLRGAPMIAVKEGNKIQTDELVLFHT